MTSIDIDTKVPSVSRSLSNSPKSLQDLARRMRRYESTGLTDMRMLLEDTVEQCRTKPASSKHAHVKKTSYVIFPNTRTSFIWNGLISVAVLYSMTFTTLHVSLFPDLTVHRPSEWIAPFLFDRIVDVLFWLDIVATFRTAIPDDSGEYRFNYHKVSRLYMSQTRFYLDLLATLPFEFLFAWVRASNLERYVRLLKILRTYRLGNNVMSWERKSRLQNGSFQFITMIMAFFVLVHWVACGWIIVSDYVQEEMGWIDRFTVSSKIDAYMISVYWAIMTLTTIGYGDITPKLGTNAEMVYAMCIFLLGAVCYSLVMAKIIAWVHDQRNSDFDQAIYDLDSYMRELHFDPQLVERVWRYMYFVREKSLLGQRAKALNMLSPSLRKEAAVAAYFCALEFNPLIEHLILSKESNLHMRQLVTELSTILVMDFYGPGEFIVNFEEHDGKYMYIIRDGQVLIKSDPSCAWTWLQGYKTSAWDGKLTSHWATDGKVKRTLSDILTPSFESKPHRPHVALKANLPDGVPPFSFGDANIVFRHTSMRFMALTRTFTNVLKVSKDDTMKIWSRFSKAHRVAKRYCALKILKRLSRNGRFVSALQRIAGKLGLAKGVRCKIVKPGSSFFGAKATILSLNWSGTNRVKVKMMRDGAVKSYIPAHLQVLELRKRESETPASLSSNSPRTIVGSNESKVRSDTGTQVDDLSSQFDERARSRELTARLDALCENVANIRDICKSLVDAHDAALS